MYDFLVDYNFIDKSDILNILKHLRTKNKINSCLALLNKCSFNYQVFAIKKW